MKAISGKEPCRILEDHGWRRLRVHGSHHIYGKQGSNVRLSVPAHANRPLKRGLLMHLLRMAGIEGPGLA